MSYKEDNDHINVKVKSVPSSMEADGSSNEWPAVDIKDEIDIDIDDSCYWSVIKQEQNTSRNYDSLDEEEREVHVKEERDKPMEREVNSGQITDKKACKIGLSEGEVGEEDDIMQEEVNREEEVEEEEETEAEEIAEETATEEEGIKKEQKGRTSTSSVEKTLECTFCTKLFSFHSQLTIHLRTHTKERPLQCNVCTKSFSRSCHLNCHMRTHTNEKPFQCTVCTKKFSQSGNLNTHMRTHSKIKPYQCTICTKCFSESGKLTVHKRTHTKEKPYQCTVCTNMFSQSHSLKRHIMRAHSL